MDQGSVNNAYRENRRGREQGLYYFGRGQLFLLAAGFALASFLVFLLGVLTGQRIEERKLLKKEGPLVKIPVQPLGKGPALTAGVPAKEEMTFYDTLAKSPTDSKAVAEERKAEEKSATARGVKPALGEQVAGPEAGAKPAAPGRVWAVQVNAYRLEKDAENLARKLKAKGYDAYIVSSEVRGRTWYRVRVGRFDTRDQARELQDTLKKKEKFTDAILVSR